jgi:transmembrane sensor
VTPTGTDLRTRNLEQIRKDAALWLSRVQLGTVDEEAFARWRDEHPAHALEFARTFANWEALGDAVSAGDPRMAVSSFTRRHLLKMAGCGAALAIGGAFWVSQHRGWTTIKTEVGEFRKISLPDTSVVELNTDTEVSWRFNQDRSVIKLARGEIAVTLRTGVSALFLSTNLIATLLSGRYNARCISDLLRLTVMQGTALIDGPGKSPRAPGAVATTGQSVTATADRTVKIEPENNMDGATAWQSGEIVFHDETLVSAVTEFNRYLMKKIRIRAPQAQFQRIGGRFKTTNPQAFLRAVSIGLGLRTTETEEQYLILPKI